MIDRFAGRGPIHFDRCHDTTGKYRNKSSSFVCNAHMPPAFFRMATTILGGFAAIELNLSEWRDEIDDKLLET